MSATQIETQPPSRKAEWRGDLFSRCCDLLVEADDKQLLAILPLLRAVVKKDG